MVHPTAHCCVAVAVLIRTLRLLINERSSDMLHPKAISLHHKPVKRVKPKIDYDKCKLLTNVSSKFCPQ